MKAVIVDIEGSNAVAMTKKGTFVKVKNSGNLRIGYETNVPSGIIKINSFVKIASIAAVFIFLIGFSLFAYNTPYSYVDIDINPSIEITANIFNRIIDIKALNTDAEKIIINLDYRNKELKDGIGNVIKSAVTNGYLKDENTNAVMLTISSKSDGKISSIEKDVQSSVSKELKSVKANPEVVIEKTTVKNHNAAIKQGISPGKLMLIQQAKNLNPDLKSGDLKDKPVKEILKLIKESKKNIKNNKNNKDSDKQQNPDRIKQPPHNTKDSPTQNIDTKKGPDNEINGSKDANKNDGNKDDNKGRKSNSKGNSLQKDRNNINNPNQDNTEEKSRREKLSDIEKKLPIKNNNFDKHANEKKLPMGKKVGE